MGSLFVLPVADVGSGIKPSDGAKLFFFDTGTGTPKNTYNTPSLITAHSNPVIADAAGVFPAIWIEGKYKVILKDKNDNQIWEEDPVSSYATEETTAEYDYIEDMTAESLPIAERLITLKSYSSTVSSGILYFITKSGTGTDDGGSVINHDSLNFRYEQVFGATVSVKQFGAVGDGATDDNARLQAFADFIGGKKAVMPEAEVYYSSASVTFPDNVDLDAGTNTPFANLADFAFATIKLDANASVVTFGDDCRVKGLRVMGSGGLDGDFARGNYAASASNPTKALVTGSNCHINFCRLEQAEICCEMGGQSEFLNSTATYCRIGLQGGPGASDMACTNSNFVLCGDAGLESGGAFWRIINNRVEQNGGYGISLSGGENLVVGNIFDRNALAGVYIQDNAWGAVITGNYFARNGAGGNGTVGRFVQSVPGHKSYIEVESKDSVHIKLGNVRDVSCTGNRYRFGNNDASDGSVSPAHIYSVSSASGTSSVRYAGEALRLGYDNAYPLVSAGDVDGVYSQGTGLQSQNIDTRVDAAGAIESDIELNRGHLMIDPDFNTGDRDLGRYVATSNGGTDPSDAAGMAIATIGGADNNKVIDFIHEHPSRGRERIARISNHGDLQTTTNAYDRGRLRLGVHYLWVDATGDLRIKSSAPTSDTDGTVVGTQT